MGRKSRIAKASLVTAFLAAGGASTQAQAEANLNAANVVAVISSYFGPMGLEDDFQHYFKATTGETSFYKCFTDKQEEAVRVVLAFSSLQKVAPPPGF